MNSKWLKLTISYFFYIGNCILYGQKNVLTVIKFSNAQKSI